MVAIDRDVERYGDSAAGGRVRDAVAHVDRVGRRGQRELDVLSRRQADRRPAGRLRRQGVRGRARADDRAVRRGVLRFLLDEAGVGPPARNERSRAARVTTGAEAPAAPALAKARLPQTILRPTVATVTTVAAAIRRRLLDHVGSALVLLGDIEYLPLSGWHLRTLEAKRTPRVN